MSGTSNFDASSARGMHGMLQSVSLVSLTVIGALFGPTALSTLW